VGTAPESISPQTRRILVGVLAAGLACFAVTVLLLSLTDSSVRVRERSVIAVLGATPTVSVSPGLELIVRPQPMVTPIAPPMPEVKESPLPPLPMVPVVPPVVAEKPDPMVAPMPEFTRKTVGRLQKRSEEELRRMLDDVPEVNIEKIPGTSQSLHQVAQVAKTQNRPFTGPMLALANRVDLQGLPMRMGKECHLGKEEAENMHALSRKLRVSYEQAMANQAARAPRGGVPADTRIDSDRLTEVMGSAKDWSSPDAIPTLMQMMTPENKPVRKVLIDLLSRIQDRRATMALAMRAVTDLSPELREAAIEALKVRPAEDYRPILLAGLRYPFSAMAEHAAEAISALDDKDSIPTLVKLLDLPSATLPSHASSSATSMMVVREVVKVNHLSNCMLCHQPSFERTDLVRGAMPKPGEAIPSPATTPQYYDRADGNFVRADITYLRQDFSVVQPILRPGNWPSYQRFDYLVRLRKPTNTELGMALPSNLEKSLNPSRDAILFALKDLTGKDLGKTSKDWEKAVLPGKQPARMEDLARDSGTEWRQFVTTLLPDLKEK